MESIWNSEARTDSCSSELPDDAVDDDDAATGANVDDGVDDGVDDAWLIVCEDAVAGVESSLRLSRPVIVVAAMKS